MQVQLRNVSKPGWKPPCRRTRCPRPNSWRPDCDTGFRAGFPLGCRFPCCVRRAPRRSTCVPRRTRCRQARAGRGPARSSRHCAREAMAGAHAGHAAADDANVELVFFGVKEVSHREDPDCGSAPKPTASAPAPSIFLPPPGPASAWPERRGGPCRSCANSRCAHHRKLR